MQTLELCDTLKFEIIPEDRIELSIDSDILTDMEGNLVSKAAKAFKERFSIEEGIKVYLEKKIPIAAGLAGGSADAAATLRAMNTLFNVNAEIDELCEIAATLGADVPFCVRRGIMLSEGIGEKLSPIAGGIKAHCVLVKPGFPVPTAFVYKNLVLDENTKHPDVDAALKAVAAGSLTDLAGCAANILESVTCAYHPEIEEIKSKLKELGAEVSLMSGSGPTVFGLFGDRETAVNAYDRLREIAERSEVILTELQ